MQNGESDKLGGRIKISPVDKAGQGNQRETAPWPNLARAALEIDGKQIGKSCLESWQLENKTKTKANRMAEVQS